MKIKINAEIEIEDIPEEKDQNKLGYAFTWLKKAADKPAVNSDTTDTADVREALDNFIKKYDAQERATLDNQHKDSDK